MHTERAHRSVTARELTLALVLLAPLAALFATTGPIDQDRTYHGLADTRAFFGIPNFFNVVSNAGFLVVGWMGLRLCRANAMAGAAGSWTVFFLGVLLVAFGSAYYHLQPDNGTLVWDRLPMTVAFMGLLSALVAEHTSARIERAFLPLAIMVGVVSVGVWHYADDLRLYAWVQFGPLLAIVYMLIVLPARYSHRAYLALGLVFYAISKVCEFSDAAIFSATSGAISGHSLKHLAAALAPFSVYLMLRARRRV